AAAAVAVDRARGLNLPKLELIRFAAQGEVAAAGFPHADNVSPAILGFFTVISSYRPLKVISLPPPKNVGFVIATPEVSFDTRLARSILPKTVELHRVVYNTGRVATFIAGLTTNNLRLMGMGMSDSIVEPARERLIPGLSDVREAAVEAGAQGVAISGAGPSVIALVDLTEGNAERVAVAMNEAFSRSGVKSQTICTKPGPGARIVRVWRV
ncbi:homoserine kinase, partial [Candidatus Bathyarchaeota archaeon]